MFNFNFTDNLIQLAEGWFAKNYNLSNILYIYV